MLPKYSIRVILRQQYTLLWYIMWIEKVSLTILWILCMHKWPWDPWHNYGLQFFETLLWTLSNEFPFLCKVFYFSDGSVAQYKSFKKLIEPDISSFFFFILYFTLIYNVHLTECTSKLNPHTDWMEFFATKMERMLETKLVSPSKG